jgi:hypothetical protein
VTFLALLATAVAAPPGDVHDTLRAITVREARADQILGAPQGPAWDAWRWEGVAPEDADVAAALDLLRSDVAPELEGHAEGLQRPILAVRPGVRLAVGTLAPVHASGDVEPGLLSARAEADAWLGWGPLEARAVARAGADVAPLSAVFLPEWRVGVRTEGFVAALTQEERWFGPARHGALLYGDAARPLPAAEIGGDWRFSGKADALGRFSARALVGWLPGERRDVDRPGWLVMDARWAPIRGLELGATRNAIFGGWEDGRLRPIDVGQLLLPTDPHVEGDPDRQEADTDERASLDARVTLPVAELVGGPVDYVEAYVQHGGEDVIARRLGPVPLPSLAGAANVYGGEIAAGPWYAGVEAAVIEDDLYRWYTGHRVYHDGWTVDGVSAGHPRGGDQASTIVRLGRVAPEAISVEASWEHVRRVQVADLVQDTLFVFPTAEVADWIGVRVSRPGLRSAAWAVELQGGALRGEDFVPGADALRYRAAVTWSPGASMARP